MIPQRYLTRPSLLIRIRETDDNPAWEEFVKIYAPLVRGYCRVRGLIDADVADVTQEVLRAVARVIPRFDYQPDRGRFRSWLLTVTRSKLCRFLANQQRHPQGCEQTTEQEELEAVPGHDPRSDWDGDHRWHLFSLACNRIRAEFQESSWQAFWLMSIEHLSAKEVAKRLEMTVGAVYVARSRVTWKLRKELERLTAES